MKSVHLIFWALFLSVINVSKSFCQVKTYDAEWKRVDALLKERALPQSALTEVKKIYATAKKEGQDAQVIKALVYMTQLQQQTREEAGPKAIAEIESEIPKMRQPALSILNSYLAGLYRQYFQQNRWKIYERTSTAGFDKKDMATWSADDFGNRITELYLQSLQAEKTLKATGLKAYDAIINKGNVRHLRPTLYDLLAHRALDYFKSGDRELNKPAYAFEISSPQAFAPAALFVKAGFNTRDTFSLKRQALLLHQSLIAFHLPDNNKEALIDVDVERLEFVYQNSVAENKDSLYEAALQNIAQQNNTAIAAPALYLLATFYENLANNYQPFEDTTYRYHRLKAKEILERVVRDSMQKTAAWASSYNLLQHLQQPQFQFNIEKVNVPGAPFRALVTYKNVPQLHFRLIKATAALRNNTNRYEDKYWNALLAAPVIKSWQQTLPPTADMQQHRVEVKVDALPVGEYFLLASGDAGFSKKVALLGAQEFYVSNISYINQNQQYFVLHRQSGQPLSGAIANVYKQQYNYKTSSYIRIPFGKYTTDKNGFFQIADTSKEAQSYTYYIDLAHNGDSLNMKDGLYRYHYYDEEPREPKAQTKVFFFTDRSIYRPGQTVYFKGIAVSAKGKENNILQGWKTKIFLEDANYEEVDSLELTTNEWGSFAGQFTLPQGGLNGRFRIYDEEADNDVTFSVEEYKRPKFYVAFDTLKTDFKLYDSVAVQGRANAYAGNTISGAQVAYRVVRQPRFIYPWLFKRGWWPRTQPMEIAHGNTTTAADGTFQIPFKAIPDLKINKDLQPVFDYRIYVDVTDINGETRSSEQVVPIGYQSLLLYVNLPEKLSKDSLSSISIRTQNRAGVFQPSTVSVTFTQLVPEQRLIRSRYWEQPDQFVMSKEEYIQHFPHDEYAAESDYRTWVKGAVVLQQKDTTSANGNWKLAQKLPAGFYEVTITTTDKNGVAIKDVKYIELYDEKSKDFIQPQYLWTQANKNSIEPGDKMAVQVGTAADAVYLIQQVDKRNKGNVSNPFQFQQLQKEKKTFTFGATEADRGGYGVTFFFVKHNRVHQFNRVINIPWSNKDLDIEYTTFRDKTLPGSEETWTVKIKGNKNEKVAAEMLASMYDASLDQFQLHNWYKPGLWPVYANVFSWTGRNNFTSLISDQHRINDIIYRSVDKQYDALAFDVYNRYIQNQSIRLRGANEMKQMREMSAAPMADSAVSLESQIYGSRIMDASLEEVVVAGFDVKKGQPTTGAQEVPVRTNFNETAFFFPQLQTDKDGNVSFSFSTPEALTRWKLQTFAHTKDLAMGLNTREMVTQKELMVQPNMPRFLRQGDRTELVVKVANLSDKELTGQVQLLLIDANTNQSVDGWFQNVFPNQYFTVAAGSSEAVKFPIEVPFLFNNALTWRVVARAGNFSDGEEALLPVLTNKLLVTETLPLPMQGNGSKSFTFDKLLNANSETLQHHAVTVEYTSNPAWLAVQALPYLTEGEKEAAEQVWNRYYANALASMLVQKAQRLKAVFENWKKDSAALLSNLQKNEALKGILLEETPWVLAAKTEAQQKQNLAILFDAMRMNSELKSSLQKLKSMQKESGGFVWFNGGPEDRYMTQYIITGIGHLQHLNEDEKSNTELAQIVTKALAYLDRKIKEDYDNLVKNKADLSKQQPGYMQVQYLYMRSFFPQAKVAPIAQTAYTFYRKGMQQHWQKQNKYMQGMTALALHRTADLQTPKDILRSLKETAIVHEELGMYWKEIGFGISPYWWNAPIETQALLIEAFAEINKDTKTVDALKTWLIKNKQTNSWRTSKATADAVYALLLQGSDWVSSEPVVQIQLGNKNITSTEQKTTDGTGYFTQTIEGAFVQPQMGNITVKVQPSTTTAQPTNHPSWGAVYWQYFEEMDKVTTAATPLKLTKKLFVEKTGDRGPVLTPVTDGNNLKIGDKVTVHIELRADRDMEYVHMKDLRASAMEPVNVLSGYKWQGGLGYYETTKDAAMHFFFNQLRKGTYVFEYSLFVTHAGNFSNGITTIQSMYAPEFSAHSEGVRINIEE